MKSVSESLEIIGYKHGEGIIEKHEKAVTENVYRHTEAYLIRRDAQNEFRKEEAHGEHSIKAKELQGPGKYLSVLLKAGLKYGIEATEGYILKSDEFVGQKQEAQNACYHTYHPRPDRSKLYNRKGTAQGTYNYGAKVHDPRKGAEIHKNKG